MSNKPSSTTIAIAIATGILVIITTYLTGCSVAVHGRLATWAATYQHEPPNVPPWGPNGKVPTTRPR